MPKGKKLNNQKVADIIASFALTNSYSATSKECSVSVNTVKNVINKEKENNAEEYAKICKDKKELFQDKANRIIDKSLELLERRYDTALNNQNQIEEMINMVLKDEEPDANERLTNREKLDIVKRLSRLELNSLSEITTSMGTLFDKMRLVQGESTNNDSITIKMSDEIKELSQ